MSWIIFKWTFIHWNIAFNILDHFQVNIYPLKYAFKGILHQKIFYCLNLIFWIVMGCGIARFGRRCLKTTETWKFWSQNLSPGVLRRGAPGVSRHSAMGFRGAAQGFRGAAPRGFEGQRQGVSRGSATNKRLQWFIILRCASRSLVIRWPLRPKRATPHPITIQNMRFWR